MPYVRALKDCPNAGTHVMVKNGVYETSRQYVDRLVKEGVAEEITSEQFRTAVKKRAEESPVKIPSPKVAKREKRVLDS